VKSICRELENGGKDIPATILDVPYTECDPSIINSGSPHENRGKVINNKNKSLIISFITADDTIFLVEFQIDFL
jgi:hypothetical protein